VTQWDGNRVTRFTVTPAQAGLAEAPIEAILGGDAAANAAALLALLQGERCAYRDTVLLNAAAALIVAGVSDDLRHGAALGAKMLDDGAALAVLEAVRRESRPHPSE
jgi:anthranilate phosphoribosyltransferase